MGVKIAQTSCFMKYFFSVYMIPFLIGQSVISENFIGLEHLLSNPVGIKFEILNRYKISKFDKK